jgi:hypothetical protein
METILPDVKSGPTFVQELRPCGEAAVTSSIIRPLPAGLGSALLQDAHLLFAGGLVMLLQCPEPTENRINILLLHRLQRNQIGFGRREQRKNFVLRTVARALSAVAVAGRATARAMQIEIVTTFAE